MMLLLVLQKKSKNVFFPSSSSTGVLGSGCLFEVFLAFV